MTREDVYKKCGEYIATSISKEITNGVWCYNTVWRDFLPSYSVDAIIDCAVEEAVQKVYDKFRGLMIEDK